MYFEYKRVCARLAVCWVSTVNTEVGAEQMVFGLRLNTPVWRSLPENQSGSRIVIVPPYLGNSGPGLNFIVNVPFVVATVLVANPSAGRMELVGCASFAVSGIE